MNPAWIAVIGTLAGALIGGGISYLNTQQQLKYQSERERKKYLLEKLDRLSESVEELRLLMFALSSKWPNPKDTEGNIKGYSEAVAQMARVRGLVTIYAPELLDKYNIIQNQGKNLVVALITERVSREPNNEDRPAKPKSLTIIKILRHSCDEFQNEISHFARRYL